MSKTKPFPHSEPTTHPDPHPDPHPDNNAARAEMHEALGELHG